MHTFSVSGSDVTRAWIAACSALDTKNNPSRTGFHTVVRIVDPTADDPEFRTELDRIRATAELREPIDTVAGTIFPAALAARCRDNEELARRYQLLYARAKRYPGNTRGTYFGRLVAYPGAKGSLVDQLGNIITSLRKQTAHHGAMTAAYEADLAHTEDGVTTDGQDGATADALIHAADRDTVVRGFPCLSHCSFQLDRNNALHAAALYRSHYMLDRAYGNYLGLGRLTSYIAAQAGLQCGTLTVLAGHARLEGPISRIRPLLSGSSHLFAA